MKRVITKLHLFSTEEGGRSKPLPTCKFGCPIYFESVPELSGSAYDSRILVNELREAIVPGGTFEEVAIAFLSEDLVVPFLKAGVKFKLWEGKIIGIGEVVRIE